MNYDSIVSIILQVMCIAGIMALAISLLMEFVVKPIFGKWLQKTEVINALVLVISIFVTFLEMIAYCQMHTILLTWYMYLGIFALGCLVAGIAMNGYDKVLSYIYNWLKMMFVKEE